MRVARVFEYLIAILVLGAFLFTTTNNAFIQQQNQADFLTLNFKITELQKKNEGLLNLIKKVETRLNETNHRSQSISDLTELLREELKQLEREMNVTVDISQPTSNFDLVREQNKPATVHKLNHFPRYFDKPKVVLDIGASFCDFGVAVKEKCPKCTVISVEPVPEFASYCAEVISKYRKVSIYEAALGGEEEILPLYTDSVSLLRNTLESDLITTEMIPIDVTVVTLDKFVRIQGIPSLDLIVIDTEGSEWRVLQGAHETLERLEPKPIILLKSLGNQLAKWPLVVEEFEWLFEHGYQRINYTFKWTEELLLVPTSYVVPDQEGKLYDWKLDPTLGIKFRFK